MKQFPILLLIPVIFFALLFVYTKVAGPLPLSVSSVVTQKTDSFTVSAEGKSTQVPDTVHLTLGIQGSAATVKAAQADLNTRLKAVTDGVKQLGVDAKDIQTANYSITPTYDWTSGQQRITGYSASATLSIKIKDADKANDVIDSGTQNGANVVGGISFEVSDKTEAENEAREKAVAEARKKAEQAARIAGFKLGKIVNYSESFGGSQLPYAPVMMRSDLGAVKEATPQLEMGSQDITVTVSISYELQ